MDVAAHRAFAGDELSLTAKEFDLLRVLPAWLGCRQGDPSCEVGSDPTG